MPKFGPNKGSENGEDMNAPKYHIKEKYCYKNFSIVFCVTAFNPEGFTTYIRNTNWIEVDFICMEVEQAQTLENLKCRARRFLKNPNLNEENQRELGIKIFCKNGKSYESYKTYFFRRESEEAPKPIDRNFDPEEHYWKDPSSLFDYT